MIVFVAVRTTESLFGPETAVLGAFHTLKQAVDCCCVDADLPTPESLSGEDWQTALPGIRWAVTRHEVPKLEL